MAVGSAGSLTVSLGLNAAEYVQGLTRAEYLTRQAVGQISRQFQSITAGVSGLAAAVGAGFGVSEIVGWAKEVTSAAEDLQKLSNQTGSSVESLSKLANIAKVSGTSFESFQTAIDRLAAGLNGSEELSTKTAAALTFLGVQSKDPATAMKEIADRLNQFADGAGKAAIARDLFGKSGVLFLTTLKDIAENTDIVATKTAEQARQAEDLEKVFRRLSVESHGLADAFLSDLAPSLEKIGELLLAATRASGGFFAGLGTAAQINPFGNLSQQITEAQDKINKLQADAAKPNGAMFQFNIGPSTEQYVANLNKQITALKQLQVAQAKVNDPSNYDHFDRVARQKPLLPYVSGAAAKAAADDPTKKILDGQIKALEDSIAREKDLLQSREALISLSFQQGYLSIKDSFDRTQEARDEALKNTIAYYDQEISLQRAFIAKSTTSEVNRADSRNKIAEYQAKEAKANADAITQAQQLSIAREIANTRYSQDLDELNAKMAELAGNTAKAAGIRFDAANKALKGEAQSRGDTATVGIIASLREADQVQKKLNDTTKDYQLILGDISIAQGYINLQQSSGSISEIEALNKTSELNKSKLAVLQQQIDKYTIIAASPLATPEQLQQLESMKLKMAELASQTDLLADKFNKTFGDAFATALSDVATGAKSFKDAFNDMAKSITKSIADMAAQDIASKLFGKGGGLTGIGDFFAKLFSGKGGAVAGTGTTGTDAIDAAAAANDAAKSLDAATQLGTSALGMTTAGTGLVTAGTALVGAATALTEAAGALVAAAGGSGAASGLGGLSSLFGRGDGGGLGSSGLGGVPGDAFAGAAEGSSYTRRGRYLVGERGPEVVNLPGGAQVISNEELMAKRAQKNFVINVNVMPGASASSVRQTGNMLRDVVASRSLDR